jgi:hypothetical protein
MAPSSRSDPFETNTFLDKDDSDSEQQDLEHSRQPAEQPSWLHSRLWFFLSILLLPLSLLQASVLFAPNHSPTTCKHSFDGGFATDFGRQQDIHRFGNAD